jgi:hypothetical protein
MLETGHPRSDWVVLLADAKKENERLQKSTQRALPG